MCFGILYKFILLIIHCLWFRASGQNLRVVALLDLSAPGLPPARYSSLIDIMDTPLEVNFCLPASNNAHKKPCKIMEIPTAGTQSMHSMSTFHIMSRGFTGATFPNGFSGSPAYHPVINLIHRGGRSACENKSAKECVGYWLLWDPNHFDVKIYPKMGRVVIIIRYHQFSLKNLSRVETFFTVP